MKALVIAQQKENKLSPVSYELIGAAGSIGAEIHTAILSADSGPLADKLAARGGGKVLAVSSEHLSSYNDQIYTSVISSLISKYQPDIVLGTTTFYGKALLSRLAAVNGGAMLSDVNGLTVKDGIVNASRPCFGGNVIAQCQLSISSIPLFISIRSKIFPESTEGDGEVITETVNDDCYVSGTRVGEEKVDKSDTVSLSEADIIVSAGRGIRGPENVELIASLAKSMKAAFGASRAIVDAGWVPYAMQVGQTGRTVNPKLYVAVGISGAIQHLVGMQTSKTIVAINKDKDAPIFKIADYGIVADLFDVVPALTAKFDKELA